MGIEGIENMMDESASAPSGVTPSPTAEEQVQGDPCPTVPTTSPDVVITEDPGPAPEGDAPVDDDTANDAQPIDPPSTDVVETVDPLADDA